MNIFLIKETIKQMFIVLLCATNQIKIFNPVYLVLNVSASLDKPNPAIGLMLINLNLT